MKTPALFASALLFAASVCHAATIYDIKAKDIDGKDVSLSDYKGKVLMIVNVASKCGNTPQYKTLETIYQKYKDKGFVVLGFPCNQFGNQEPGSSEQIKQFCVMEYQVTFPMFEKVDVKGTKRHPLYTFLSGEKSPFPGDVKWNFGKFLVGKDGTVVKRFEPGVQPDAPEVTSAIEAALAK